MNQLAGGEGNRLSHYIVRKVVPVLGEASADIANDWNVVRFESNLPISIEVPSPISVIQFYGMTQNLHYTSDAQRQELDKLSRQELGPSNHSTAVLIPIRKSEAWWELSQDQRQAYFQKTKKQQGHTAMGLKYVDRVFRKLYHSRYLNAALGYDFLTYFEFEDVYEKDFTTLLAELRDTEVNPEWVYVSREFEIWMTKIG